jgi:hypothetical protein
MPILNLASLHALGFAASAHILFTKQYRVRCNSCQALVINGTPAHERGCPEAQHECAGCNEIIPLRTRYCAGCLQ